MNQEQLRRVSRHAEPVCLGLLNIDCDAKERDKQVRGGRSR
jgi:hypothetical protein